MNSRLRLISLGFRLVALASKFGFFVVVAIFLEPEQVGQFGLIAVTVNLSLYFLGLDFYIYANREFRVSPPDRRRYILSQSAYLFAITHLTLLPLYLVLFQMGVLPWSLFFFIVGLSILEHLSTEFYRLLIVYGKPALASFCFFLRLGLWPLLASFSMWMYPQTQTIEAIMAFWVFGAILSILVPAIIVVKIPKTFVRPRFDRSWIIDGLRIALPFLAGTLCLRGMQTLDRYLINGLVGPEILGAFVFFAGLASVLPAMLQAGVYSFSLPVLLSSVHDQTWKAYAKRMKELRNGILIGVVTLSAGTLIGARLVLIFIERPIYLEHYNLLFFLILANVLFAISMYFHLALHAMRQDWILAKSHVVGLVAFLICVGLFVAISPYYAVPIGLVVGNGAVLLMKYSAFKKNPPSSFARGDT